MDTLNIFNQNNHSKFDSCAQPASGSKDQILCNKCLPTPGERLETAGIQSKSNNRLTILTSILLAVVVLVAGTLFNLHQQTKTVFVVKRAAPNKQAATVSSVSVDKKTLQKKMAIAAIQREKARLLSEKARLTKLENAKLAAHKRELEKERINRQKIKKAAIDAKRLAQQAALQAEKKFQKELELEAKKSCSGDCQDGIGSFLYENGDRYVGLWKNGLRSGKGTFIYANGDKYIGQWKDGERFGSGEKHLMFAQYNADQARKMAALLLRKGEQDKHKKLEARQRTRASFYENESGYRSSGCLFGNCINGRGSYLYSNGDSYTGQWQNSKKHGLGAYKYTSGASYVGAWEYNRKHGKGIYTFINGKKYSGDWRNGIKHGVGIIITKTGRRIRGIWNNGKRIT